MTAQTSAILDHAAPIASDLPRLCAWQVTDRASHIPASMLRALAAGADAAAVAISGLGASLLLEQVASTTDRLSLLAVLAAAVATAAGTCALGLDRKTELLARPTTLSSRLILSLLLAVSSCAAALHLADTGLSRTALAAWLIFSAIGLIAARTAIHAIVDRWSRQGRLERRAAIYGTGGPCADLIRSLEADPACDVRIVGVCDDRGLSRAGGDVLGYPRIGTLDDLLSLARRSRIDTVIVTVPTVAEKRLLTIFERLSVLPADVRQPATVAPVRLARRAYSSIGSQQMLAILDKPMGYWGVVAKSALDRSLAALALLLLAPVLAAVALAVKLESRGPVLFRQKRYGFNNELIEIFKFRSMYVEQSDANADRLVTKGDARVTGVGRFIRKTSLDELPQLFNVLLGSLSLVGPRPHAVNAKAADRLYGDVVSRYFARHKVKPGITGWAQINGWRGETDTEEKIGQRVAHDLYYIENWSLLLDFKILLSTPLALLKTDNAY